jgi:hypothetical protein
MNMESCVGGSTLYQSIKYQYQIHRDHPKNKDKGPKFQYDHIPKICQYIFIICLSKLVIEVCVFEKIKYAHKCHK